MRWSKRTLALLAGCLAFAATAETMASSPVLLAVADEAAAEPYIVWVIKCLGGAGLMMLIAAAVIFIGACVVVFVARRPAVIAAYLVFLPLPWLLGLWGAINGTINSYAVIARADVVLKQSQIFGGLAEALVLLSIALTVTFPSYFVIAIGLFVRTIIAGRRTTA